jgi:uncharacterized protein involved in response to NO
MSIALDRPATRHVPIFFSIGFRPFFLAAALWSALALTLWIVMLTQGIAFPSRFDPLSWHIHEMMFGFVMAAIGGFLLTAVANWTNRPPVHGWLLAILSASWLLGRIVCLISALLPVGIAIAADLSFAALLVAVIAREITAAKNWRNLPLMLPVIVLAIANLVMHLDAAGVLVTTGLGWRLALAATVVLISAVAGRIVPAFTRNWLAKRGGGRLPASVGWIDRGALALFHTGLFGWAILPQNAVFGALLVLGGALNVWRLARWRGERTFAEPLLTVLHLGYGWLALGSALLGLSTLDLGVPQSAAVHALTAGAIGTMILAVMTRATRGHTGRPLSANGITVAIYVLVNLGAVARVAAAFAPSWALPLLIASGGFWIAAFALFALSYGPMLLLRRISNLTV